MLKFDDRLINFNIIQTNNHNIGLPEHKFTMLIVCETETSHGLWLSSYMSSSCFVIVFKNINILDSFKILKILVFLNKNLEFYKLFNLQKLYYVYYVSPEKNTLL